MRPPSASAARSDTRHVQSRRTQSRTPWIAAFAIAVLYFSSTAPTPLYPLYRQRFGFDEFIVTAIYAVYAMGNLVVLFLFGRLSDQIGRRRAAIPALVLTALCAVCYLSAMSTPWLFVARILNGFAAGLGAGALTAWIAELEPDGDKARAATIAAAANLAGLAAGALVAGPLAQYAPSPLRLVWLIYLVLIAITVALVRWSPETIDTPVLRLGEISFRPRIGVPSDIRLAFVAPAVTAFAAFALGGFYAALVPGLLGESLHVHNLFVVGAVVALFFTSASAAAIATRGWRARSAVFGALALYAPALALLILAEALQSMSALIMASIVAGTAMALGYRGSLQAVNAMAPDERRAEVLSSFLLACYSGNSIPIIGAGLLALRFGAVTAHRVFAGVLVALAIVATVVELRQASRK